MMLEHKEFDLGYRPKSYWGPQDLQTHYGARAKGELRREAGLALLDEGIADDGILTSSLSNAERSAAGAVHPWLMGGEYLPDYLTNEVEIARVTMKSTTMDVISVRARRTKQRIIYRIVDEYMDDFGDRFSVKPKMSKRPLSMGQLIQVIEANELVDGPREGNYEGGAYCSPNEIFDFCTVSSAFYIELDRWFDEANEAWLEFEREKLEK